MNLVSLCPNCHSKTQFGLPSWTFRLQALMSGRFPQPLAQPAR
jgi:hypothetical protein